MNIYHVIHKDMSLTAAALAIAQDVYHLGSFLCLLQCLAHSGHMLIQWLLHKTHAVDTTKQGAC